MTRSVIMSPLWVCMLFFVAAYAETDVCISNKLFFKECDEAAIRAYSKGRKWTVSIKGWMKFKAVISS